MVITGWSESQLKLAIALINVVSEYDGNIKVNIKHQNIMKRSSKIRIWCDLRVNNPYVWGARTAATGKHGRYASWEAHRDFMLELFKMNPDGVIHSTFRRYTGIADFLLNHKESQNKHIFGTRSSQDNTFGMLTIPRGYEKPKRVRR